MKPRCTNCRVFKARRNGRCQGCDKFYRAMGYERPEDLVERAIERVLHQEMRRESHACHSVSLSPKLYATLADQLCPPSS